MAEVSPRQRNRLLITLDLFFFVFGGVSAAWLAYLVLQAGISPGWPMLLMVLFWVLAAYLALPRIHRILTAIYLPDYFIGRARTADGLLGDPVNLALRGSSGQIHQAMRAAGWTRADEVTLGTGWRIVTSTLTGRSYAAAPVSPLLLFGRQQDFAYQQEVAGSPSRRHHVRFWKCPPGWLLPGGFAVDWLAAGTYDRSVGLSLFTGQITHKIDQDVDIERDHILDTVTAAAPAAQVELLRNFSTGYHSRNGGGDRIETDGDLPVVDLSGLPPTATSELAVEPEADGVHRPPQVVFGALVAALLGLEYLGLLLLLLVPDSPTIGVPPPITGVEIVAEGVFAAMGLVNLLLALALLTGRDWARVLLCGSSVVSIVVAWVGNAAGTERISLSTNLAAVAVSVLVLLALSSEPARTYAEARRSRRKSGKGSPAGP
ncbi:MAG TPA: LssY C-terminal domain-containing protein [Propionicimonas sp.]|uniref:LssY C-terminal domain-containing protein n=1 Tax=Propionicimonas sp. TaxID=1955623 RepID=UPI002F3EB841